MPVVITLDFDPQLGRIEESLSNLAVMMARAKRRVKQNTWRKWKIFKTQVLDLLERLGPDDDERPILKEEKGMVMMSFI